MKLTLRQVFALSLFGLLAALALLFSQVVSARSTIRRPACFARAAARFSTTRPKRPGTARILSRKNNDSTERIQVSRSRKAIVAAGGRRSWQA